MGQFIALQMILGCLYTLPSFISMRHLRVGKIFSMSFYLIGSGVPLVLAVATWIEAFSQPPIRFLCIIHLVIWIISLLGGLLFTKTKPRQV